MSRKIKGNLIDRILRDDETSVSVVMTGVVYMMLPELECTNLENFFIFILVYIAVFTAVHYIMDRIEKRKSSRYITVPKRGEQDVC